MRMIFTTWAWPSHLHAVVPLAWACRAAGHDVLVATEPELVDAVVGTGLPAVATGEGGVDTLGMVRGYLATTTGAGARPRPGGGPRALRMVQAHAESMVDDLVAVVRGWRADVVVYETTTMAGPVAAAAAGVPAVRHLYGTDLLVRAASFLPDLLRPLAERHRTGEFDPLGIATVDPLPAGLRLPAAPDRADVRTLPMRHVPFNGPGVLPTGWDGHRDRPLVGVTWGHTIARLDPQRFLAGQATTAVAGLDVDVVVVVAESQLALLPPMPANVRVVVDTPLLHVLPQCDLVVSHGGASTILTALGFGLPLVLVPQLPDHRAHSERVEAAGAGAVLTAAEATADQLQHRVADLLAGGTERGAAEGLRAEMARRPAPADLVPALESLVQ